MTPISTNADIDIDVFNRDEVLKGLNIVYALQDDAGRRHNTGVYFNPIPKDVFTDISLIHYEEAARLGYFKVDFLNVHIYEGVKDEAHLVDLLSREPLWEMLEIKEVVSKIFQINQHYDLVKKLRPDSIEKLAALISVIRPAKRYLENCSWDTIFKEVWIKPDDGSYHFKKSHAISYALATVVQMNLMVENVRLS